MKNLSGRNVTIIDLNFPLGSVIPAFVSFEGRIYRFNNTEVDTEVEDMQLLTNYEPYDVSRFSEQQIKDLLKSAMIVDNRSNIYDIYALQVDDGVSAQAEVERAIWRDMIFVNGGSGSFGTRWNYSPYRIPG